MAEERMGNERETQINRNAIGHRAAWMGLIYDEAVKAGVDIEDVMRKAIARRGEKDGEKFRSRCEDASASNPQPESAGRFDSIQHTGAARVLFTGTRRGLRGIQVFKFHEITGKEDRSRSKASGDFPERRRKWR